MAKDEVKKMHNEESVEEEDSLMRDIAKRFVPLEDPLPETEDTRAILEMLGRIEHELILYRRERVYRTYLLIIVFMLPILGLGYLIPSVIKGVQ